MFIRRLKGLGKVSDEEKQRVQFEAIKADVAKSEAIRAHKLNNKPNVTYPEALPVSQKKEGIAKAIAEHQVVIIAGETGSGKTTQIPKICLELGRGVAGLIGHTQPRRIAARSVANRIAEELDSELGGYVGYKVRFTDQVSDDSYIKLMTDGILLAEIQHDRFLNKYDTIIIDEAHERSLNIDFLLGYLKQLLSKRPDLKLIITSATIDQSRFSKHFNNAPIIEVSGRTFPVETRYRPIDNDKETENDQIQAIFDAVDELSHESRGDILIFMNGEREIRDTADALEKRKLRDTEIVPLYARLTVAEQNRVFQPHSARRIVLATNVAETSLTVPGIKYVIDPGTARISRYSYRTKVQRLPIEPISQASANQRQGRCGRVSNGICIRLYSEDDFLARPEFTDPEILRTNLASVILQMLSLGLGDIEKFPFVQAPDRRNITDGVRLLEELEAVSVISNRKNETYKLTNSGKQLARFPVDPRLAKMVLTASQYGAVDEVMIIVSALSIQDPRERPAEYKQQADTLHSRFYDKESDFLAFLNLWGYLQEQQEEQSRSQFRKLCKKELLAYMRVREWQDVYWQLKQAVKEANITINTQGADFEAIHRSLLSGLLSHVGFKDVEQNYKGARNSKFYLFPGSNLFKKQPKWVMAAELVETSRLYGRVAAKIQSEWIEPLAQHLVKRSYSEPHWNRKRGSVVAYEQQALYGLVIVAKRSVTYTNIDPVTSREIFIREALVNDNFATNLRFMSHNRSLIKSIEALENKVRRRDLLVDEQRLYEYFDENIPEGIACQASFLKWYNHAKKNNKHLLCLTEDELLQRDTAHISALDYPDTWTQGNLSFSIQYDFDPASDVDGISVVIPLPLLNQVEDEGFDWLVPGLQHTLIVALIKSLPKQLRRNFVPAPNYADAVISNLQQKEGKLIDQVTKQLLRMTGVKVSEESWDYEQLPSFLKMHFIVVDEKDKKLASGYSLDKLKQQLQGAVEESLKQAADPDIEQAGMESWSVNTLPEVYVQKKGNFEIKAYPALIDEGKTVGIKLIDNQYEAEQLSWIGVRRLILMNVPSPIKYLQESLPNKAKLGLYFNPFGQIKDLINDCIAASVDSLIQSHPLPRDEESFTKLKELVRAELGDHVVIVAQQVEKILSLAHAVKKRMKGNIGLAFIHAFNDIKDQIDNLVFSGFVQAHGVKKLDDIARYVSAINHRMEKLAIDPHKDKLRIQEVEKVSKQLEVMFSKVGSNIELRNQLNDVRWMIEELRVSLFAQSLGTPYPISAKRILNKMAEL